MKKVTQLALSALLVLASSQASAITWGQPDGEDHPNVVVLLFLQNGEGLYSCSGTLLTPYVVMTAGHCTEGGGQPNDITFVRNDSDIDAIIESELFVTWGGDLGLWLFNTWVLGAAVPHPDFDDYAAFSNTYDIGLEYQALELTFDRRFADNWSLLASYRWSRLWGNYEGFFRNDNGQGAPAQSSLFDFPTNDPSYTEIGVPQYGFRGDIRYLGELGEGPLPTDRPHLLKVYGTHAFDAGLSLGCGLTAGSGRPLTPMAANPATSRRGEIPEAPRGDGIETEDGTATRTPYEWSLDLHADYGFEVPGGRLVLAADVFNLFDMQRVVDYDQDTQLAYRVTNPDYGKRIRYQEPRQVRLAVRYEF